MRRLESNLGQWVIAHRWWILGACVLFFCVVLPGLPRLRLNNDSRVFFSERNPQLQAFEALEKIYTKENSVLFIVAPRDGDVFSRETLPAVQWLTEAAWKMPYASRVDSITNFQHVHAREDDVIVEDLVPDAATLSDRERARVKRIALSEPTLVDRFVSPSGHVTGVNVDIILPEKSPDAITEIAHYARHLAATVRQRYPGVDILTGGMVMMDEAFAKVGHHDMMTLAPLILVVLILISGLALRSLPATLATLFVILGGMFTAMGFAGWIGIELTPASVGAPTIILTLAVANSVHILATMLQQMRRGRSKHEAIADALRENLQPVVLTSATTAIGFLSMNVSDAPPFRDLGNIVAIGVVAALVFSILLLPAMMTILPVRVRTRPKDIDRLPCDRVGQFVVRHRRPAFWGALVVIVICGAGTLQIELDDDWIKYFGERYEVRRATDFAEAHLTGAHPIQYSLASDGPAGIHDPEYLATVEAFANWYREQPNVVHVNTITDVMKRLNQAMHGDDEAYYRIPAERDLAAQYLLLYELSLPYGLDLTNQINIDKSATRMVVSARHMTTRSLRKMDDRARAWLAANAPESMFTYGTGMSIIWAHLSERNIKAMLWGSFGALVLISGLLIFALRSLKLGLVSLIPNLTPGIMGFGLWGIAIGQVGLGLSVVISMTLGIVVDDTVHFLSRYRRARREQRMQPADAVRAAFNNVGTAMLITTVALVAGFLVLTFSDYQMSAHMGLMSAITVALALVMDFVFLPTLLMRADRGTWVTARSPRAAVRFTSSREQRGLECPEDGAAARVEIVVAKGNGTATSAEPMARIETCSLWPHRAACNQACVGERPATQGTSA
jgi:predicted RND superfamily exporter protein